MSENSRIVALKLLELTRFAYQINQFTLWRLPRLIVDQLHVLYGKWRLPKNMKNQNKDIFLHLLDNKYSQKLPKFGK